VQIGRNAEISRISPVVQRSEAKKQRLAWSMTIIMKVGLVGPLQIVRVVQSKVADEAVGAAQVEAIGTAPDSASWRDAEVLETIDGNAVRGRRWPMGVVVMLGERRIGDAERDAHNEDGDSVE